MFPLSSLGCVYLDVAVQLRWTALLVPLGRRVDGGVGGEAIGRLLQPHGLGRTGGTVRQSDAED